MTTGHTVPIVDAHLDLAWNALGGRDVTLPVADLRAAEGRSSQQIMATLPELSRAGVAIAFGTLYVGAKSFDEQGNGVYEIPPDDDARAQLDVYRRWEEDGRIRIVVDQRSLDEHLGAWRDDSVPGLVVLIEGGDSVSSPDDLQWWWDAGVRIVGPAWTRTRYCGGTRAPGPLTDLGRDLLAAMHDLGVILDVSHMAEESFWEAMSGRNHRVIATHANARRFVSPRVHDRHLSDEMLGALRDADGVIGVVPANVFLSDEAPGTNGHPITLDAVKRHLDHIAGIVGWHRVGIGSDLDGGFGKEETPVELDTEADLRRFGDLVPSTARDGVLGQNWLRVLRESLPR